MSNVVALDGKGAMTAEQVRAFHMADAEIVKAIDAAKAAGVAQGLLVALLHAHAHRQTAVMLDA